MNLQLILIVLITACVALAGCSESEKQNVSAAVPIVVTADIQAGIEKHIEEQTRLGDGYFQFNYQNRELRLKLVRVHTEYLANLGLRRHFACVDLANIDGNVYDVDFFLEGDPGEMKVTETTLHKINGQPEYLWEQKKDGTWHRIAVKKASRKNLGVITGSDEFEFIYRATLPEITQNARMWLPLPATDSFQKVKIKSINGVGKQATVEEHQHGNKAIMLELSAADSNKTVEMQFHVRRLEKSAYTEQTPNPEKYLNAERLVPVNENFRNIAEKIVEGKSGDLVRARALYDHVIDRMRYMKYGSGWGKGDAVYACDAASGNCTDFHSYFIALARAVGIPSRFAIGVSIPSERSDGGIDGYHCWAEFYAEDKWWPVDISEGDKYSALSTYYFGHHPANRLELSRGRDLVFDPGPESGPINFLAYPLLEIGGSPVKVNVEFSFNRASRNTSHD